MVGKKGRSGRPKTRPNIPFVEALRKDSLRRYYADREKVLERMRKYHKKIKDYSIKHKISFEEARERLKKLKEKST